MAKRSDGSEEFEKYIVEFRMENQQAERVRFNACEHQLAENKEEFGDMAQDALEALGLTKNVYRNTNTNKEILAVAIGDAIAYNVQRKHPEFSATELVQMAKEKITNRIVLALDHANTQRLNDKVGYAAYEKGATKSPPDQSLIKAKKPSLLKRWRKAAALVLTASPKKAIEEEPIPVKKNLIDSTLTDEVADEARRMANLLNWHYEEGAVREFSVNQEVIHQIVLHQIAAEAIAIVSKNLDDQIHKAENKAYAGVLKEVKQDFDSKRNSFMKSAVIESAAYAVKRSLNFGSEHLDQNISMSHQELLMNERVTEMDRQLLQSMHEKSAPAVKPPPLPASTGLHIRPSSATQLSSQGLSATPALTPSPVSSASSSSVSDTLQLPQQKPPIQSSHHRNWSDPIGSVPPPLPTTRPRGRNR